MVSWPTWQIMFNLDRVYMILDEMIINGTVAQTSRERILAPIQLMDSGSENRFGSWLWREMCVRVCVCARVHVPVCAHACVLEWVSVHACLCVLNSKPFTCAHMYTCVCVWGGERSVLFICQFSLNWQDSAFFFMIPQAYPIDLSGWTNTGKVFETGCVCISRCFGETCKRVDPNRVDACTCLQLVMYVLYLVHK